MLSTDLNNLQLISVQDVIGPCYLEPELEGGRVVLLYALRLRLGLATRHGQFVVLFAFRLPPVAQGDTHLWGYLQVVASRT